MNEYTAPGFADPRNVGRETQQLAQRNSMSPDNTRHGRRRQHSEGTIVEGRRWTREVTIFGCVATFVVGLVGCKAPVATKAECDEVSKHLADLVVNKEKVKPGRLSSAPFNGPDEVKAVFEEARAKALGMCEKGFKRAVFECMVKAVDLPAADKCRSE